MIELKSICDRLAKGITDRLDESASIVSRPWGSTVRIVQNDRILLPTNGKRREANNATLDLPGPPIVVGQADAGQQLVWSAQVHDVLPGQRLSLHRHHARDEFFMVLKGDIFIQIADERITGIVDDWYSVPAGVFHRIAAGAAGGRVLEMAFGLYDQINDIERLDDDYGRVGLDGSV